MIQSALTVNFNRAWVRRYASFVVWLDLYLISMQAKANQIR
jgi:hypothetical protein